MSVIDVQLVSLDDIDEIVEYDGESEAEVEAHEVIHDDFHDYDGLDNKPQIEGITLEGDKTFEDLNLKSITNTEIEELLSLSV